MLNTKNMNFAHLVQKLCDIVDLVVYDHPNGLQHKNQSYIRNSQG